VANSSGVVAALPLVQATPLPLFLPSRFNSVVLGAGSPPFVLWLALASYRDVQLATGSAAYLPLQWIGITTGEGPLWVAATVLIGIIAPALAGWALWRLALAHFE